MIDNACNGVKVVLFYMYLMIKFRDTYMSWRMMVSKILSAIVAFCKEQKLTSMRIIDDLSTRWW